MTNEHHIRQLEAQIQAMHTEYELMADHILAVSAAVCAIYEALLLNGIIKPVQVH